MQEREQAHLSKHAKPIFDSMVPQVALSSEEVGPSDSEARDSRLPPVATSHREGAPQIRRARQPPAHAAAGDAPPGRGGTRARARAPRRRAGLRILPPRRRAQRLPQGPAPFSSPSPPSASLRSFRAGPRRPDPACRVGFGCLFPFGI